MITRGDFFSCGHSNSLCQPIKPRRVLGLITLGEKRSAQPYSANDYALLDAIGEQIARRIEREEIRTQINEQSKAPLVTLARLEAEIKKQQSLNATPSIEAMPPAPDNNQNNEITNPTDVEKPPWI